MAAWYLLSNTEKFALYVTLFVYIFDVFIDLLHSLESMIIPSIRLFQWFFSLQRLVTSEKCAFPVKNMKTILLFRPPPHFSLDIDLEEKSECTPLPHPTSLTYGTRINLCNFNLQLVYSCRLGNEKLKVVASDDVIHVW